jgi:V/A-type H+-transporting ATPase subunit E
VGLDGLLTTMARTAEREAEGRRAAAREAAGRLVAEARARVAARLGSVVADREAILRREMERAVARERQARRGAELQRRQALLSQVRDTALARLPEVLGRPAYQAALARDLAEALSFLGERAAVAHTPPALQRTLKSLVAGRAELEVRPDPARTTGPVLITVDGALTIDLTLATRLEAQWDGLSQLVAGWLEQPA